MQTETGTETEAEVEEAEAEAEAETQTDTDRHIQTQTDSDRHRETHRETRKDPDRPDRPRQTQTDTQTDTSHGEDARSDTGWFTLSIDSARVERDGDTWKVSGVRVICRCRAGTQVLTACTICIYIIHICLYMYMIYV